MFAGVLRQLFPYKRTRHPRFVADSLTMIFVFGRLLNRMLLVTQARTARQERAPQGNLRVGTGHIDIHLVPDDEHLCKNYAR